MTAAHGMLIGGEWLGASESFQVHDKYSGEVIGTLPKATPQDVGRATAAAREAFRTWSERPAHERATLLRRAAEGIAARRDDLASLICREAGKAWKYLPSFMATSASSSPAVTTPWPARPCQRISVIRLILDTSSLVIGRNRYVHQS